MGALAGREEELFARQAAGERQDKPLRMENLHTDVPPNPVALEATTMALTNKEDNSYLPFVGQLGLREAAAAHVSRMTGRVTQYSGEANCVITAGGLSGVLNTLFATVEPGEGLAGAVPVLMPLDFRPGDTWKFSSQKLADFIESAQAKSGVRIPTLLLSSPALPSDVYLDEKDWQAVAEVCISRDLILIYDVAFERLLFDDQPGIHPASFVEVAERTVTVGSASKELRLVGWRVCWVVGSTWLIPSIQLVGMANVVVPVGIAQKAAQAALEDSDKDCLNFTRELQARRDLLMHELKGLLVGIPVGGWSFVLKVETGKEATRALMEKRIFTTPMQGWGEGLWRMLYPVCVL